MAVAADVRGPHLAHSSPSVAATRILVVDDEDSIRLVLARFLKSRGFDVAVAESGDAALETLSTQRFDLMLCDVRMPGRSGVEIVSAALEIDPQLGIVMLSAVNDAPTATEAMTQGVLDYLTKPVELADLHSAVMRALEKKSSIPHHGPSVSHLAPADRDRAAAAAALRALAEAMREKDEFLRRHSARVNALLAAVGRYVEPTDGERP